MVGNLCCEFRANSPLKAGSRFLTICQAVPHTQLAQLRIILSGPTVVCEAGASVMNGPHFFLSIGLSFIFFFVLDGR